MSCLMVLDTNHKVTATSYKSSILEFRYIKVSSNNLNHKHYFLKVVLAEGDWDNHVLLTAGHHYTEAMDQYQLYHWLHWRSLSPGQSDSCGAAVTTYSGYSLTSLVWWANLCRCTVLGYRCRQSLVAEAHHVPSPLDIIVNIVVLTTSFSYLILGMYARQSFSVHLIILLQDFWRRTKVLERKTLPEEESK